MTSATAVPTTSTATSPDKPSRRTGGGTPQRRPVIIRAAPRREPPFDDELPTRHLNPVGPHDQPLPFDDLAPPPSALRLHTRTDPFGVRPTGRSDLPALDAFVRRFIVGVIEVATGRRSANQLAQHTSPSVHSGLARDSGKLRRLGTARKPAQIHSVHISEPADGVAEVAVVVRVDDSFRAVALRLEGLDGRWRCVRLQVG